MHARSKPATQLRAQVACPTRKRCVVWHSIDAETCTCARRQHGNHATALNAYMPGKKGVHGCKPSERVATRDTPPTAWQAPPHTMPGSACAGVVTLVVALCRSARRCRSLIAAATCRAALRACCAPHRGRPLVPHPPRTPPAQLTTAGHSHTAHTSLLGAAPSFKPLCACCSAGRRSHASAASSLPCVSSRGSPHNTRSPLR